MEQADAKKLESLAKEASASAPVLSYTVKSAREAWPWSWCLVALLIAIMLQFVLLPCLCGDNAPKLEFAAAIDVLFVLRMIAAFYFREKRGWLVYSFILLSSAFWIEPALTSQFIVDLYSLIGIHPMA